MKTPGWQTLNKELCGGKQSNLMLFPKSWKIYAKVKTPNLLGDYVSRFLFLGFTTTRLAFDLGNFFCKLLFWKKAQSVWEGVRRWELGDVLASSERLLGVKRADFYLMNLAVLLQVYALGIDLAVRWIAIWIFLKMSYFGTFKCAWHSREFLLRGWY